MAVVKNIQVCLIQLSSLFRVNCSKGSEETCRAKGKKYLPGQLRSPRYLQLVVGTEAMTEKYYQGGHIHDEMVDFEMQWLRSLCSSVNLGVQGQQKVTDCKGIEVHRKKILEAKFRANNVVFCGVDTRLLHATPPQRKL